MTLPPELPPEPSSPHTMRSAFDLTPPYQPPPLRWGARRFWPAILVLLVFLASRNTVTEDRTAHLRAERLENISAALRATKAAYVTRESGLGNSAVRASVGGEAIQKWAEITHSEVASVSDWRRLGIAQMTFGQRKEGLKTLRHISLLSEKQRYGESSSEKEKRSGSEVPWKRISATEEARLWEQIYGRQPVRSEEVTRLRGILEQFELGWFGRLAREALYTRAGQGESVRRERAAALSAAQELAAWSGVQFLLLLSGVAGLVIWGLTALVRAMNKRANVFSTSALPPTFPVSDSSAASAFSEMSAMAGNGPVIAQKPPLFSYRARLFTFLSYFVVPLIAFPIGRMLKAVSETWSLTAVGRLSVGLYLLLTVISVVISIGILMRLTAAEGSGHRLSYRDTLHALGMRSKSFWGDVCAGVAGYAMILPIVLLVTVFSNMLFARFKTPPHPVLMQMLAMQSPFDKTLLLLQTAVTAAIVEELMFRGVFYPALRARWGVAKGIALSAAVFALAHPTLPGGFLPLWTLGAAFTLAYEKRGSLVPGMVMHALNNGMLLMLQFATFAE